MARIARLKTQLPRTSPTGMSGAAATATVLKAVASSGSDVTVAIRIRPTQLHDSPVSAAMASP